MLSARLHPSGWFADASSPMDHRKTSSTVMKICKKRTALHCLKGQDPPPSLSKWKQKTGTGKKIALSKNHNLDQSYLFGTNSCHQPLVPNSILSRKGANVLFFLGTYIYFHSLLPLTSYLLFPNIFFWPFQILLHLVNQQCHNNTQGKWWHAAIILII